MRTGRSILNFASVLLFTAATALTALITTPLLVGWLDEDRYGAFRMVVDFSGYLTLLDLGLGGALSPLLARALGRGDAQTLRGTLAAGMRAYGRLTLLIMAVGLVATPLVVWLITRKMVRVPPGFVGELRWAWLVVLLGFLPLALSPFRTLAEAGQRGYWINLLLTAQCLLITALSVLLAWAGWGVAGQACAATLGVVAFFAMMTRSALRRNPGLLASALAAPRDPGIRAAIRGLSVPALIFTVSGRVGLLSDGLIVGSFLGPALAASLYTTVRLATLAQGQLQAIGAASWAGLAELHAQGAREVFNRRLVELTTLVAVLGLAVLGPIAAYGRPFFELWMGGKPIRFAGDAVVAVAAVNALALGLVSLWGWCFSGTGQMRQLVAPTVIATAVNLAVSLVATWRLGVLGPVLGTLVANLGVTLWWLPILLRRDFGIPLRDLTRAVAWPMAWGLPYAAGLWWVARVHRPWGWPGLAAEMGAAALGFLALGGLAILSPTDRALWRVRLAGLLRWLRPSPTPPDDVRPADPVGASTPSGGGLPR